MVWWFRRSDPASPPVNSAFSTGKPGGSGPRESDLEGVLLPILKAHPQGLTEYDLFQVLKTAGIAPFVTGDLGDDLVLFRTHFLLFHTLYRLRNSVRRQQRWDLDIHCLKIVLRPWRAAVNNLPDRPDSLQAYYLNPDHLETVQRQEVTAMMNAFWQQFDAWQGRDQALLDLGLTEPVNRDQVKKRFRELAFRHHPDRGGDADRFRRIQSAAERLLG